MEAAPKKERLFTFASAGWVLLLAFLFTAVGTVWNLAPLFDPNRVKPRGDGRTAASYGFDLSRALVPKDTIVSSGMVVDALKALDDPATMGPRKVPLMSEVERGKYLVASDRVIGVEINGQSRAYPLRVLNWHEVVNDVVSGVPIAVTYHPLSEGVAVFDRRVNGETMKFGVSGLLHDSNLLMYDRRGEPGKESLWSQLQARAIAGPAAGATLARIPSALSRFDKWTERYPKSAVLAPILAEVNDYKKDAYGTTRSKARAVAEAGIASDVFEALPQGGRAGGSPSVHGSLRGPRSSGGHGRVGRCPVDPPAGVRLCARRGTDHLG